MAICLFEPQQNRRLLALALPMILSNITVPLLGLVDSAVIGHLSHPWYLGGVALGAAIITLLLWLLGFLRMSTTGLIAQAMGAGDEAKQLQILGQSSLLALSLGGLLVALQSPLWWLAEFSSAASELVLQYGQLYFQIRIWSAPFALLTMVLLGWLLGRRQAKAAMLLLICGNLLNIVLDLWLVLGLTLGVAGAAIASVIADIVTCALAAYLVKRTLPAMQWRHWLRQLLALPGRAFVPLLTLNRDIFIRSLCLQLTFAFMTFKGAGLGDSTVAANALLLNLMLLIAYGLDGIAYYAEVEVGQAYGQGQNQRIQQVVALGLSWSAVMALLFCGGLALTGSALIALLTDIDSVRVTASHYLPWLTLMPLLSFACYLFDGVYIGAAKGTVMRNSMLIASLGVFLPLWWLLAPWGNHGLWAALSGFMLARSLTLATHFWRRRHCFTPAAVRLG